MAAHSSSLTTSLNTVSPSGGHRTTRTKGDTMSESTNIGDKLKQKIDEMDIDRHVNDFVVQVEGLFAIARDQVASLAEERGDDVERLLDKVSTLIDERTQGRFSPQVHKVRETVSTGVTKLAEQRSSDTPPTAPDGFESPPAD